MAQDTSKPNLFTLRTEGLFSDHYLAERLPQQPFWSRSGLEELHGRLLAIYRAYEKTRLPKNEENTRNDFLDPVLEALGYSYHRETATRSGFPDYVLFASMTDKQEATAALKARGPSGLYGRSLGILEAKYWDRPLENVVRDDLFATSDASGQVVRYLMDLDVHTDGKVQWGILTNGHIWRLFWHRARNRVSNFYEVDLDHALKNPHGLTPGSFDTFKRFVLFFEQPALCRDLQTGKTRLDSIVKGSEQYALKLADDLKAKIFDPDEGVFLQLAKGFTAHYEQEQTRPVTQDELDAIYHGTLTLLYRLLFILYAESRGLLPVENKGYSRYGLGSVCKKALDLLAAYDTLSSQATDLWTDLLDLFKVLERGDRKLNVPRYNGGLFHSEKTDFFATFAIADPDLIRPLLALTREKRPDGLFSRLDYQALGVRQLGSIYEGLLEFRLRRANAALYAVDRGGAETWVKELPPGAKATALVNKGQVYLVTDKRERRISGSYYTPDFIVKELVRSAVGPVFEAECLRAKRAFAEIHGLRKKHERASKPETIRELARQLDTAEQASFDALFAIRVLDPAMGSGHFLVEVVDFLSSSVIAFLTSPEVKNLLDGKEEEAERKPGQHDPANPVLDRIASQRQAILAEMARQGIVLDEGRLTDSNLIKRMVMKRCAFGVDLNPMAVELAKVSLWLDAFTLGAPLSFLDHHLKAGNSLVGTTPERAVKTLGTKLHQFELAGMLAATDTLRTVAESADVTLDEVHHSSDLYQEAEKTMAPLKRKLDVVLAEEEFGVDNAKDYIEALDALLDERRSRPRRAGDRAEGGTVLTAEARDALEAALGKARDISFFHWPLEFPEVFYGAQGPLEHPAFDAVVGNPPWERIKLQENEFFAQRSSAIAFAPTAAARKRLIAELPQTDPALRAEYELAKGQSDALLSFVRDSGDYPLMGKGDTNLYAVFVERAVGLAKETGRCALVVPSGIATDKTTSDFFRAMVEDQRLAMLLDFENREGAFPTVDSRFKFTLVGISGKASPNEMVDCAFFLHGSDDLKDPERRFPLTAADFAAFNPNTLTSPVFRTKRDAEITRKLYAAAPILIRHKTGKTPEQNPWKVRFLRMFDMTNDSGLFKGREELEGEGFWLGAGNVFTKGEPRCLPLYEGKMVQLYDHRAASVEVNPQNLHRPAQPRITTSAEYADPNYSSMPQFWVDEGEVNSRISDDSADWLMSFKNVCSPTNMRTFLVTAIPRCGVGNSQPVVIASSENHAYQAALLANLSSMPFDYGVRTKVGGQNLNFFIVEQFPVFAPETYAKDFHGVTLLDFILPRVLELTYTAHDMAPFAKDMGFDGPPFAWDEERRLHLRSQLDALFFLLYGLDRDDAAYVLSTFPIVKRQDEAAYGRYRTRDLILAYMAAYDAGNLDAWVKG